MNNISCRFCNAPLVHSFIDLGMSPLSNAYLREEQLGRMEPFYPLHAYVCDSCLLVQLPEYATPETIFTDYAYFSSFSDTWLKHAEDYAAMIIGRLGLDDSHLVVEIASNDGYLLKNFVACRIPVLGIEPAKNVAMAAEKVGVSTCVSFFGRIMAEELAAEGRQADLIIGNNVLAHVPDLNDFVSGLKILLGPGGVITMEFPHLMRLIEDNQFDTIYHEHFSYFSLHTVMKVFAAHGLRVFDVEQLPTHGGSLRIYAAHEGESHACAGNGLERVIEQEQRAGLDNLRSYISFHEKAEKAKRDILEFLIGAKAEGKRIVGYGAPAKGSTLLNYCGIRTDFLDFTVDRSPHKQGLFMPGTRVPICHPDRITDARPDYLFVLPWNLKEEIMAQMSHIRNWGGRFVLPIPHIRIYS